MKIELKASSQRRAHTDRFGQPAERTQHIVVLQLEGISFYHDCESVEVAREVVLYLSQKLGIK